MLQFKCPKGHRYGIAGYAEDLTNQIVRQGAEAVCYQCRIDMVMDFIERLKTIKQCLTSGNSVACSDPRPALKYLNRALDYYEKRWTD